MKALYYTEAGKGAITEIPKPLCGDDQVIVEVKSASICKGVEVGHANNGTGLSTYPVIPGHEFAGVITEVGKNVTKLKVGDRVTADNTELCDDCYFCKQDKPLYCENFGSIGHNINGGFAEYVVVKKEKIFKIPDDMDFNTACMTEPVACCIHAMDRLNVQYGEVVVVVGGGPNGQILSQMLCHSNANKVFLIDKHPEKLALAEAHGAIGIQSDTSGELKHFKKIREMYPLGVDAVIDATGNAQSIADDFKLLKTGGRLLQYAVTHEGAIAPIETMEFFLGEFTYYATKAQTHCFGRALDAMISGDVDVKSLVTSEYSLDDYFIALDKTINDRSQLKIVIHP